MNFDLANVQPFLSGLEDSLDLGLDIEELSSFVRSVPVEEEVTIEIDVSFGGTTELLRLTVFMDDYGAPDLFFFSRDEKLANAIQERMITFAKARGM